MPEPTVPEVNEETVVEKPVAKKSKDKVSVGGHKTAWLDEDLAEAVQFVTEELFLEVLHPESARSTPFGRIVGKPRIKEAKISQHEAGARDRFRL